LIPCQSEYEHEQVEDEDVPWHVDLRICEQEKEVTGQSEYAPEQVEDVPMYPGRQNMYLRRLRMYLGRQNMYLTRFRMYLGSQNIYLSR
jgi:hypothetical protein